MGDRYLSQNNVNAAKKKYAQYKWVVLSAKSNSLDEIRSVAGQGDFLSSKKIILIKDIPNKKAVRVFLLDLVKMSSPKLKFIIWDSEGTIKVDPKKRKFNKTWTDWINEFKKNSNHKIVNNGTNFSEKEDGDCIKFIQTRFAKGKKKISANNATMFAEIVGRKRGMLESEINKLLLTCPQEVTEEFILENTYSSSKEAILYKFGNVLDTCSYCQAVMTMQQFLDVGINENVMADIIVRKARWQLAAASYWRQGMSWSEVIRAMMQMGKYPSSIWHDKGMTPTEKRKATEGLKELDDRIQYITKICGVKDWQVNAEKKAKRAEVVPMEFMAKLTTDCLRNKMVAPVVNKYKGNELRNHLEVRCIKTYLFVLKKLKEIRYGENPKQDLQEMIAAMTNKTL